MGVASYLASLNMNPAITAKLQTIGDGSDAPPMAAPITAPVQTIRSAPTLSPDAADALNHPTGSISAGPQGPLDTADLVAGTPGFEGKSPDQVRAGETAIPGGPERDEAPGGSTTSAASPGRYVPAHWQPGTRSETIQHGIDPNALREGRLGRQVAQGHGFAAADKHLEAAQMQAEADAHYAEAMKIAADNARADQQRIANERAAYVTREQEKLASLSVAAREKVDPEAAKGNIGSQIFAAIGIALGQFGASLNGGPNAALQIVNANIDRKIKAQEGNIANAHKALGDEQSLYHQNLEAFGDKDRAVLATKMQYIDQVKALTEQTYAKAKGISNEGNYHATMQALDDKYAEYADQFGVRTADQVATSGNEHFVPGQTVGGGGPTKDLPNVVTSTDGTSYQMPNDKQQDKAIEKIQLIGQLQRYNNEALQVRKRIDGLDPILNPTDYRTAYKTLQDLEERKAGLLSSEAGQGVLRESEYARSVSREGFYTSGVGFFKGNPFAKSERDSADANLRTQIARGDADQKAYIKAAGGHIVKRGYAKDASGQLTPVAKYTGQDAKPTEQLPPKGFKSMKAGQAQPTAEAPDEETTPMAEDFGSTPSANKGPAVKRRR